MAFQPVQNAHETGREIPFLDILVIKKETTLNTKVYRKSYLHLKVSQIKFHPPTACEDFNLVITKELPSYAKKDMICFLKIFTFTTAFQDLIQLLINYEDVSPPSKEERLLDPV
jgi:hypothetical protein